MLQAVRSGDRSGQHQWDSFETDGRSGGGAGHRLRFHFQDRGVHCDVRQHCHIISKSPLPLRFVPVVAVSAITAATAI